VQGSYPSEAACQGALEGRHGPYLTSLEQLSTGGKNPAIGRLEHTASRYRWEVGMPGHRSTFEAWCATGE
jgi:hypothetical protein